MGDGILSDFERGSVTLIEDQNKNINRRGRRVRGEELDLDFSALSANSAVNILTSDACSEDSYHVTP